MYPYIEQDIKNGKLFLDNLHQKQSATKGINDIPLLKQRYAKERHYAKVINFSIAYGKTAQGLAEDCQVSINEARALMDAWYECRPEVRKWQRNSMVKAIETGQCYTMLGRPRSLFDFAYAGGVGRYRYHNDNDDDDDDDGSDDGNYDSDDDNYDSDDDNSDGNDSYRNSNRNSHNNSDNHPEQLFKQFGNKIIHTKFVKFIKNETLQKDVALLWKKFRRDNIRDFANVNHNFLLSSRQLSQKMRQAINTPIQGSAADIVVKAMLNVWNDKEILNCGYQLILQIHDEIILEGPQEHAEHVKAIVIKNMENIWLGMDDSIRFSVDAKVVDYWSEFK
ncbi:polymerase gamma 2 [Reticulomyxa filosa]|uniref:Polymerase gamma 2 n=1 Tax=Reticulomyxa filosa TaxID=46433 RepID=X6MVA4_RETFI|nr:polymerase gamma 2 [Reticulomyxa filosa]|eukprot:ETO17581.1 polymerase gamma 2 [Reticulomyxa filosa]